MSYTSRNIISLAGVYFHKKRGRSVRTVISSFYTNDVLTDLIADESPFKEIKIPQEYK